MTPTTPIYVLFERDISVEYSMYLATFSTLEKAQAYAAVTTMSIHDGWKNRDNNEWVCPSVIPGVDYFILATGIDPTAAKVSTV